MNNIQQRLEMLRDAMRREQIDAYIVPSTDPHHGEYVPEHWESRKWLTGFDGSAGTVVVTLDAAALWTDSRYFIQAAQQLQDTGIQLMRMGEGDTPSITEWIGSQLDRSPYRQVGLDGYLFSYGEVAQLTKELRQRGGITLRSNYDPFALIWRERPEIPLHPVTIQREEDAGESAADKLSRIRRKLRDVHADGMLVARLDDIAWTLNLRGSDVHCTPLFVAYLLIAPDEATLYIDLRKLTAEVSVYLRHQGVKVDDYTHVADGLQRYFAYNILLDPDEVSYALCQVATRPVIRESSPIPALKAVKNERERLGFKMAMLRDGIAMTQLLCWIEKAVERGGETELSVARKLEELRALQPRYVGPSFDTISAYQEHGAIVHYEPTPLTDAPLLPEGFLLLDAGGQYLDGTTDITRTIPLGPLTDEQRRIYTLVLKGHIRLQLLQFPEGVAGTQLDAVARVPLWSEGLNYQHGTGHGVGSFLSVHEGPHQIRMQWVPQPLVEGMTVTDEPGIYLEGRFGVRIENTLITTLARETEFGRFLRFETLTLCPIPTSPVIAEWLSPEEKAWLDTYNHHVCEVLTPHLDPETAEWMKLKIEN